MAVSSLSCSLPAHFHFGLFNRKLPNFKEDLKNEVDCLRSDIQQARDDRDHQLGQVQSLITEINNYKELTGKSAMEVEKTMTKISALEESCSSQRERIQALLHELAVAKEKLKMADLTATQTMTEYEEQKNTINDLRNRLADAEYQIADAEKLRKELHNTILELKGNIRVFCSVRPILSDSDSNSSDGVWFHFLHQLNFVDVALI